MSRDKIPEHIFGPNEGNTVFNYPAKIFCNTQLNNPKSQSDGTNNAHEQNYLMGYKY